MKVASATLPGARRILDEHRAVTHYSNWGQRRVLSAHRPRAGALTGKDVFSNADLFCLAGVGGAARSAVGLPRALAELESAVVAVFRWFAAQLPEDSHSATPDQSWVAADAVPALSPRAPAARAPAAATEASARVTVVLVIFGKSSRVPPTEDGDRLSSAPTTRNVVESEPRGGTGRWRFGNARLIGLSPTIRDDYGLVTGRRVDTCFVQQKCIKECFPRSHGDMPPLPALQ